MVLSHFVLITISLYEFHMNNSEIFSSAEKKRVVKGVPPLPWSVRYKVAVGIAEAIEYLHNGTERCVVHRDIKPSNILLSSNKSPKARILKLHFDIGFFGPH